MQSWSLVLLSLILCAGSTLGASEWETDYEVALEKAKQENRFILLNFSGSDWCGWCIRLDREVFAQKQFLNYAGANLVCVKIDSPRRKALPPKLQKQNQQLKAQFRVAGFPTVLILSPEGEKIGHTGYKAGGPKPYIEHLETIIKPSRSKDPRKKTKTEEMPGVPGESRNLPSQSSVEEEVELLDPLQSLIGDIFQPINVTTEITTYDIIAWCQAYENSERHKTRTGEDCSSPDLVPRSHQSLERTECNPCRKRTSRKHAFPDIKSERKKSRAHQAPFSRIL